MAAPAASAFTPSSLRRWLAPGVTATASARDLAFVAGLGARDVLDYSGRFEDQVRDVDVVIDPVGGTTTARSWPVMRSGGTLVAVAEEPDPDQGGRGDVRGMYFVVRPDGGQLRELATLVDKQQLRPAVSAVFERLLGEPERGWRHPRGCGGRWGARARGLSSGRAQLAALRRPSKRPQLRAGTAGAPGGHSWPHWPRRAGSHPGPPPGGTVPPAGRCRRRRPGTPSTRSARRCLM